MFSTSWTQVHIKGLSETVDPDNEELEDLLEHRYGFTTLDCAWAGPGSTIVKRSDDGACRGYAFISFLSADGAAKAIERINEQRYDELVHRSCTNDGITNDDSNEPSKHQLPLVLHAELCKPKPKGKSKKKAPSTSDAIAGDLRFRRQRGAPIRKHPVIRNSDGSRTGLGNKTK